MADLHGALAGPLVSGAHALGVVHAERHGLFLVDVLARVERRYEMLAMQMLRRGDEDRVDALVVQKVAVVEIGLGRGRRLERGFETLCVDIGEGNELGVGAGDRCCTRLIPRAPGPMMPTRMRSLAPRTRDGTDSAPASPAALPMNSLRVCIILLTR
jgi:hypothetical protein